MDVDLAIKQIDGFWLGFFLKPFQNVITPLLSYLSGPHIIKSHENSFDVNGKEYIHFSGITSRDSAVFKFYNYQKIMLAIIAALIGWAVFSNWMLTVMVFISLLTVLYFTDLIFNLFLIYQSLRLNPEIVSTADELRSNIDWPTYTIFCPLYKEWAIVPQFITAMGQMDYPQNKLQVLFLLEADDQETIAKFSQFHLPSNMRVVIVPHTFPKTKPKACNVGLRYATGEYCVIYDAEDIPDPLQLKKAVLAFKKLGPKYGAMQAKLNFYNAKHNILTRLFTADYSLWFDLVLTGLQSIHAPIPLGGTSNHFRTQDLRQMGGWDAFNVTEDADLGMRLSKRGFKTAVIDSTTLEEATSGLYVWYKQRTRWIKGYFQTYIVHARSGWKDANKSHLRNQILFHLVIGGKIVAMLVNPIMWILTISYFVLRGSFGSVLEGLYIAPILYLGTVTLFLGNFLYFYYFMMGISRREQWSIIPFTFLTPLYWVMISAAAINALIELIVKPFHWNKTTHGAHIKAIPASNVALFKEALATV